MSERPDFTFEADEIERHLEDLKGRTASVIRQLKAGKTLGEEDISLVAQRARTLGESLDRADRKILAYVQERRMAKGQT